MSLSAAPNNNTTGPSLAPSLMESTTKVAITTLNFSQIALEIFEQRREHRNRRLAGLYHSSTITASAATTPANNTNDEPSTPQDLSKTNITTPELSPAARRAILNREARRHHHQAMRPHWDLRLIARRSLDQYVNPDVQGLTPPTNLSARKVAELNEFLKHWYQLWKISFEILNLELNSLMEEASFATGDWVQRREICWEMKWCVEKEQGKSRGKMEEIKEIGLRWEPSLCWELICESERPIYEIKEDEDEDFTVVPYGVSQEDRMKRFAAIYMRAPN